ncbi:putative intracellular septation protein [Bradyrhizobium sp. ORS 375]|uniref:inner membrane-spanning protein YciB n=1 Tax=Bradyrhizobium sp. (strain ORS 375) TaxID=566679 RepID=UPI0002407A39|nr:septation protein IspZ [Bradyrhizobium sp. ORS 375]CCD92606.1 putative intracellular septation protein [Bradyrhizobium sp. ORS 375]
MKDVFTKLTADFLSAAVFFILYLATDDVVLATSAAVGVAIVQVVWARIKGHSLGFMAYASIALVVVLGSVTLLTNDPRFMFAKPAIGHFAIGLIMLKRGWMLRYVPPMVAETIPEYVTGAGYAWAALMFALGLGTIGVAMTGDIKLWVIYMTFTAAAKVAAFGVQFIAFRFVIASRLRAARA